MRGVRVFLIVFGACAVVAALALPWLFHRVSDLSDTLNEDWKRWKEETSAFVAEHEQADCAPEAIARAKACEGFSCDFKISLFVEQCLKEARQSPKLCADFPKNGRGNGKWLDEKCSGDDVKEVKPQTCMLIYSSLAQRCASKRAPKKL